MANEILTETRGRVRILTLNRPEARNAVNTALGQALVASPVLKRPGRPADPYGIARKKGMHA